ncbi:MAG: FHA domain-containing protein [Polyangiaceae bacterium]|jgi:pSer/pThr/pTyr-binding forkhead associated (FHA) protein
MWKLVIEDDEGKRTVVPLTRDRYSLGRKEGNTIRLTERNVSRDHARLHKRAIVRRSPDAAERSTFVVEDLTSYNGVFVNGLRLTHAQDLVHGDLVQIGDYRLVLQDEALMDTNLGNDAKQTVPNSPNARAAALLDRPNRLVMLAGPTPAAEFPLDHDRMTVGRAEDANVSINHNSVSRLHCEVHALGDGRFEIVDKGSSNGVRVNGAELRRGIVEPGDVIELGDVKFKFVGAGQIFLATESQQLEVIGDRQAPSFPRGLAGSHALPLLAFTSVVLAGVAGVWVYAHPRPTLSLPSPLMAPSPDRSAFDSAKALAAAGQLDDAHRALEGISVPSALRTTPEFADIENRWADQMLVRADGDGDVAAKRAKYLSVSGAVTVDPTRRKVAADKLQALDALPGTVNAAATGFAPTREPAEGPATPKASPGAAENAKHEASRNRNR